MVYGRVSREFATVKHSQRGVCVCGLCDFPARVIPIRVPDKDGDGLVGFVGYC